MAEASKIEWTDHTWNPLRGCTKISAGCKNCYAETFAERFRGVPGHPYEQGFDLRLVPEKLGEPLGWKKPRRVFVNSMSDLFHEDVPVEFIAHAVGVMLYCRRHEFQVLTKRAGRLEAVLGSLDVEVCLNAAGLAPDFDPQWPPRNVLVGVTVEDQRNAGRLSFLSRLANRGWRTMISAEPLLGRLDLLLELIETCDSQPIYWHSASCPSYCDYACNGPGHPKWLHLPWVICGGESGRGARPMHPAWARGLRDQCAAAGVPFFFKQWGEWRPCEGDDYVVRRPIHRWNDGPGTECAKVGKKAAGRLLDGREWNEMPAVTAAAV